MGRGSKRVGTTDGGGSNDVGVRCMPPALPAQKRSRRIATRPDAGRTRAPGRVQRKDVRLVKHRGLFVVAGLAILFALVVSMSVASAGTKATRAAKAPTAAQIVAAIKPPAVPGAAAIKKKYGGQTITFVGDSVGGGHKRDLALAQKFSASTGIKVERDAASHRVGRVVLAARESVLVEVGLDRRGDDRRRLAWRLRALPRRPQAEARQAVEAPRCRESSRTTPSTGTSSRCRGSATSGSSTTAPTC